MRNILPNCTKYIYRLPLPFRYGLLLALCLILLKTLEYQLFSFRIRQDIYLGLIALFFIVVGLSVAFIWSKLATKHLTPNSATPVLTAKEIKLLCGLKEGLTNQQLADTSFVSINTVKTQLKALYKKLEVSSRAEAVQKAKTLSLF